MAVLAKQHSMASEFEKKHGVHRIGRTILGTLVTITLVHPDADEARKVTNLAFDEIYRVHNLMSVYDKNSEVYALNRDGFYENASPETIDVIKKGIFYSKTTEGAFNIAILPVLRLWQEKAQLCIFPTESEIGEALKFANWKEIIIEGRNIRFKRLGMGVTLGGVAKGFAIDKAIKAIINKGVTRAMVNGGGDIRVTSGTGGAFWRIGVRNPDKKRGLITVVELSEEAIATSGTYLRSLNDIINDDGKQAAELRSSTVIACNAMDADALSTSAHILGFERGMRLIEGSKGVEALVVTQRGHILESSDFRRWRKRASDSALTGVQEPKLNVA